MQKSLDFDTESENGVKYINKYVGADEEFFEKIYEMLEQFCALLKTPEGKPLYTGFKQRLLKVRDDSEEIAWGFGDAVDILVDDIEEFFEEDHNGT